MPDIHVDTSKLRSSPGKNFDSEPLRMHCKNHVLEVANEVLHRFNYSRDVLILTLASPTFSDNDATSRPS